MLSDSRAESTHDAFTHLKSLAKAASLELQLTSKSYRYLLDVCIENPNYGTE
jgi:hypothetical protein